MWQVRSSADVDADNIVAQHTAESQLGAGPNTMAADFTETPVLPALESLVSAIWVCPENNLQILSTFRRYQEALSKLGLTYEMIVVINGDKGSPAQLVHELVSNALSVRVAWLHRFCDQAVTIRAALEKSQGDLVVLLPPYPESDPEAIKDMIAAIQRGAHYVASRRVARLGSKWSTINSRFFNLLTRYITGIPLHDINSELRVMKRSVMANLPIYGDLHQFLPIMAALQGFVVTEVDVLQVDAPPKSKRRKIGYHLGVYLRRVLDLLTLFFLFRFTKKPLRFFGLLGSGALIAGGGIVLVVAIQRISGTSLADRPLFLLGVTGVVMGVQLISLGLLGELIIFTHGRHLFQQYVEELDVTTSPNQMDQ
jgi:hypothetical protein